MCSILAVNCGSSSLKFALFDGARANVRGAFLGIGARSRLKIHAGGDGLEDRALKLRDTAAALRHLFAWLDENRKHIDAVGHRLVHGGRDYFDPQIVTPRLQRKLRRLASLAPEHLPHELDAIDGVARWRPRLKQCVCFDTAFHRHLPPQARLYALPRKFAERGVVRYGFHGLSYESAMHWLAREAGRRAANARVIVAHLGSGASVAAIRNQRSIDTSMGFTPAGGLLMSTRSGDLDPGVPLYLIQQEHLSPARVNTIVNRESGLLGLSGISADVSVLLSSRNPHAREAVDAFCYRVRTTIGAYAAALGGLDQLVFTGGIGEHAPVVRKKICDGLAFLGVTLDARANAANAALICARNARVKVRVAPADEEAVIARSVAALLDGEAT